MGTLVEQPHLPTACGDLFERSEAQVFNLDTILPNHPRYIVGIDRFPFHFL